ncbi:MAG: hypothetical protein ABRQ23_01695 [Syntrophomonadaceae bacterium]
MNIKFSPQSKWGEQSMALLLVFCLFLIIARLVVAVQHPEPNQPLFSNLPLDIPMLCAIITAILGGIVGLYAMVKEKDYSITVSVATIVGMVMLFLVIRNFAAPF